MRDFLTFWGKPDRWPRDTSTNVFLGRTIDQIGRTMFGAEWRDVFDVVAKLTDPIPANKELALPWQTKHAFELYLKHRPQPPLDAFSAKRRTLNDNEWQVARDLIRKLNNDVRPSIERYNSVERAIIAGAEAKRLVTTLRPTAGGEFTEAPNWWWNSETISNRFDMCQMNPNDPFGRGIAGDGYCWIFVTQESLKAYLDEHSKPKSEFAEQVTAALADHGSYYDMVPLPGKKQQAVFSAIKTVWPDGRVPRLLSIADIEKQINPVVKRMGDPGGASADNIRRALGLKK